MKKAFKFLSVVAVTLIAFTGIVFLSACGGAKAEGIVVGRNDMPRLTYVEGQDLDFSKGKLTVQYKGGKTESVALNGDGVSVSGYDKNTAGRQTVTITYKKLNTTIDVMVIARVAAENVQTVYYVGEHSLDTAKGKIRIANDDGSTFLVSLSDASVTLSGFDSSQAAESQTITVRYQKNGADYTGSYKIRIYGTENAKFTAPVKTSYRTHENLQVSGAYITYTNGTSEKKIPVTADMVSGYDFSAVTEQNSPMEQTCTVNYGGQNYNFKITVTYSNVTKLQNLLKEETVDWTGNEIPAIGKKQGDWAVECANLYFGLSASDQKYIDADAAETAIRTAGVYAYGIWSEELEARKESFVIKEDGLKFTLSSYEAVSADYAVVNDPESSFNAPLTLFSRISSIYADLAVGEQTMKEYLAPAIVYYDRQEDVADVLSLTVSLYEAIAGVPETWSDLSAYAENINAARDIITEGRFNSGSYRDVYALVSSWRTNDDVFDIIYSYYVSLGDEGAESIDKLKNIILPGALNRIYYDIMNIIQEYSAIVNGTGTGYASDSSLLVYYYRRACKRIEEIYAGENELHKTLCETLEFDNIVSSGGQSVPATFAYILRVLETTKGGYYELMSGVLDDGEISALWDTYLTMLTDTKDEDLPAAMHALIAEIAGLSPGKLKSFLLSVNVYYEQYEKLSLDTEINYTYLIRILKQYYSETLSEEEFGMFRNLLLAVESYARISDKDTALADFLTYIGNVKTAYDALGNKEKFQADFDGLYQKYLGYADLYDGETLQEFTVDEEWQKVLDRLANEIVGTANAYALLNPGEGKTPQYVYARLFASYEAARRYADDVLTNAPDSVKAYYYHKPIEIFKDHFWTLDYAMSVQTLYLGTYSYVRMSFSGDSLLFVVQGAEALRAFYADAVPVVWTDESAEKTISAADAVLIMKKFLTLSDREKLLFAQLQDTRTFQAKEDGEEGGESAEELPYNEYYYDGLLEIFKRTFENNENLLSATQALFDAEKAFIDFGSYSESEVEKFTEEQKEAYNKTLAEIRSSMAALETAVEALGEEETTLFNEYFSEILSHYRDAYTQIPAEEVSSAPAGE